MSDHGGALTVIFVFLAVICSGTAWGAEANPFAEVKSFVLHKDTFKASKTLLKIDDENLSAKDRALKYFALGLWEQQKQKYDQAESYFYKSMAADSVLSIHDKFQLALNYKYKQDFKQAQKLFEEVRHTKAPRNMQLSTRYELSDLYMKSKKWHKARRMLVHLERRWRGDPKRP